MSRTLRFIFVLLIGITWSATSRSSQVNSHDSKSNTSGLILNDGTIDPEAARQAGLSGADLSDLFQSGADPFPGGKRLKPDGSHGAGSDPRDVYWQKGLCVEGVNGDVRAMTVFEGRLVIGGDFTIAHDTAANCVAAWDGSHWIPLGSGFLGQVTALTVFEGNLIAGGAFYDAYYWFQGPAYMWSGSAWVRMGTNNWVNGMVSPGGIEAFAEYHGQLYAAGSFTIADGDSADHLAYWNGTQWKGMRPGFNTSTKCLAVFEDRLIVGGGFSEAGGSPAGFNGVAAWNGSVWTAMGNGVDSDTTLPLEVRSFAVYNGQLYAAGGVDTWSGGSRGVVVWDGTVWAGVGGGLANRARVLEVYDGRLIAGGHVILSDTLPNGDVKYRDVAAWDGSSWSTLGTRSGAWCHAMAVHEGALFVGGGRLPDETSAQASIVSWSGTDWQAVGPGLYGKLVALAEYDGRVIVGGSFKQISGVPANRVAAWDGNVWTSLDDGVRTLDGLGKVNAIAVYRDQLIVAGTFDSAGSVAASNIAVWDGSNWSALGAGVDNAVKALCVYNDKLYVAGYFTVAGQKNPTGGGVAAWDGNNWIPVAPSPVSWISAMATFNNVLVIGGLGVPSLATWNGAVWITIPANPVTGVSAMAAIQGRLIVARSENTSIVAWDGANWSQLGSGPGLVSFALSLYNNQIVAGGGYYIEWGVEDYGAAAWNGTSWTRLGSGTDDFVRAMIPFNGDLIVAGDFEIAGGKVSAGLARWNGPFLRIGDANGSGFISVADVVFLVNYIFSGGSAPNPLYMGDADCSGAISISDAVFLIRYIFSGGPEPCTD